MHVNTLPLRKTQLDVSIGHVDRECSMISQAIIMSALGVAWRAQTTTGYLSLSLTCVIVMKSNEYLAAASHARQSCTVHCERVGPQGGCCL